METLRKDAARWTLDSDDRLLRGLQNFSEYVTKRSREVEDDIATLAEESRSAKLHLANTFNQFLMLQNSQFIENRVAFTTTVSVQSPKAEDDATEKDGDATKKDDATDATQILERYKSALTAGMKAMDYTLSQSALQQSMLEELNGTSKRRQEEALAAETGEKKPASDFRVDRFAPVLDEFNIKPLPHLILSAKWKADEDLGMFGAFDDGVFFGIETIEEAPMRPMGLISTDEAHCVDLSWITPEIAQFVVGRIDFEKSDSAHKLSAKQLKLLFGGDDNLDEDSIDDLLKYHSDVNVGGGFVYLGQLVALLQRALIAPIDGTQTAAQASATLVEHEYSDSMLDQVQAETRASMRQMAEDFEERMSTTTKPTGAEETEDDDNADITVEDAAIGGGPRGKSEVRKKKKSYDTKKTGMFGLLSDSEDDSDDDGFMFGRKSKGLSAYGLSDDDDEDDDVVDLPTGLIGFGPDEVGTRKKKKKDVVVEDDVGDADEDESSDFASKKKKKKKKVASKKKAAKKKKNFLDSSSDEEDAGGNEEEEEEESSESAETKRKKKAKAQANAKKKKAATSALFGSSSDEDDDVDLFSPRASKTPKKKESPKKKKKKKEDEVVEEETDVKASLIFQPTAMAAVIGGAKAPAKKKGGGILDLLDSDSDDDWMTVSKPKAKSKASPVIEEPVIEKKPSVKAKTKSKTATASALFDSDESSDEDFMFSPKAAKKKKEVTSPKVVVSPPTTKVEEEEDEDAVFGTGDDAEEPRVFDTHHVAKSKKSIAAMIDPTSLMPGAKRPKKVGMRSAMKAGAPSQSSKVEAEVVAEVIPELEEAEEAEHVVAAVKSEETAAKKKKKKKKKQESVLFVFGESDSDDSDFFSKQASSKKKKHKKHKSKKKKKKKASEDLFASDDPLMLGVTVVADPLLGGSGDLAADSSVTKKKKKPQKTPKKKKGKTKTKTDLFGSETDDSDDDLFTPRSKSSKKKKHKPKKKYKHKEEDTLVLKVDEPLAAEVEADTTAVVVAEDEDAAVLPDLGFSEDEEENEVNDLNLVADEPYVAKSKKSLAAMIDPTALLPGAKARKGMTKSAMKEATPRKVPEADSKPEAEAAVTVTVTETPSAATKKKKKKKSKKKQASSAALFGDGSSTDEDMFTPRTRSKSKRKKKAKHKKKSPKKEPVAAVKTEDELLPKVSRKKRKSPSALFDSDSSDDDAFSKKLATATGGAKQTRDKGRLAASLRDDSDDGGGDGWLLPTSPTDTTDAKAQSETVAVVSTTVGKVTVDDSVDADRSRVDSKFKSGAGSLESKFGHMDINPMHMKPGVTRPKAAKKEAAYGPSKLEPEETGSEVTDGSVAIDETMLSPTSKAKAAEAEVRRVPTPVHLVTDSGLFEFESKDKLQSPPMEAVSSSGSGMSVVREDATETPTPSSSKPKSYAEAAKAKAAVKKEEEVTRPKRSQTGGSVLPSKETVAARKSKRAVTGGGLAARMAGLNIDPSKLRPGAQAPVRKKAVTGEEGVIDHSAALQRPTMAKKKRRTRKRKAPLLTADDDNEDMATSFAPVASMSSTMGSKLKVSTSEPVATKVSIDTAMASKAQSSLFSDDESDEDFGVSTRKKAAAKKAEVVTAKAVVKRKPEPEAEPVIAAKAPAVAKGTSSGGMFGDDSDEDMFAPPKKSGGSSSKKKRKDKKKKKKKKKAKKPAKNLFDSGSDDSDFAFTSRRPKKKARKISDDLDDLFA